MGSQDHSEQQPASRKSIYWTVQHFKDENKTHDEKSLAFILNSIGQLLLQLHSIFADT